MAMRRGHCCWTTVTADVCLHGKDKHFMMLDVMRCAGLAKPAGMHTILIMDLGVIACTCS